MTLAGGGPDLKAVEEFVAPDDGNPDDRTVARYPLPEPVPVKVLTTSGAPLEVGAQTWISSVSPT